MPTNQTTTVEPKAPETPEEVTMSASFEEIKAACLGADNDFICQQLEAKSTLDQARENWMLELAVRAEDSAKQLSDSAAQLTEVQNKLNELENATPVTTEPTSQVDLGVDPVNENKTDAPAADDYRTQWKELVNKYKKQGLDPAKATLKANREAPELRQAFVNEVNA